MGRKPKIAYAENGDVDARIKIPRPIWLLGIQLAREYEMRPDKAVVLLLKRIGDALVDPRRSQVISQALGPDVAAAIESARRDNFGAIASGVQIDVSRLARSTKLKSGFVGVYPQGSSAWRAEARSPSGMGVQSLGLFRTAEEAAWARLMYYDTNDLPYGLWEEAIDRMRKAGEIGSDADLIQTYEETNRLCGTEHLNLLPGKPKAPSSFRPNTFTADITPIAPSAPVATVSEIEEEIAAKAAQTNERIGISKKN